MRQRAYTMFKKLSEMKNLCRLRLLSVTKFFPLLILINFYSVLGCVRCRHIRDAHQHLLYLWMWSKNGDSMCAVRAYNTHKHSFVIHTDMEPCIHIRHSSSILGFSAAIQTLHLWLWLNKLYSSIHNNALTRSGQTAEILIHNVV